MSPKAGRTKVDHQQVKRAKFKPTGAERLKSPSNFNPRRDRDRRNRKTEDSSSSSFEKSRSPKTGRRRRRMRHVNETSERSPEWAKKSKSSTRDLLEGDLSQEKNESKKVNQRLRSPNLELTSDEAKRKRCKPKKVSTLQDLGHLKLKYHSKTQNEWNKNQRKARKLQGRDLPKQFYLIQKKK